MDKYTASQIAFFGGKPGQLFVPFEQVHAAIDEAVKAEREKYDKYFPFEPGTEVEVSMWSDWATSHFKKFAIFAAGSYVVDDGSCWKYARLPQKNEPTQPVVPRREQVVLAWYGADEEYAQPMFFARPSSNGTFFCMHSLGGSLVEFDHIKPLPGYDYSREVEGESCEDFKRP